MGLVTELVGQTIGSVGDLFKMGYGAWQTKKGRQMLREWEKKRPTMRTPGAIDEMVNIFRDMSTMDRLPGQDIAEGNIRSSTATGIEAIKDMQSGAGGLGAIAQMVAGEQDQFADMSKQLEEMIFAGKGKLAGALGTKGQYQQMAWDWNERQKWEDKMAEANAMLGAGTQNVFGGGQQFTQSIGDAISLSGILGGSDSGGGDPAVKAYLLKLLSGQEEA